MQNKACESWLSTPQVKILAAEIYKSRFSKGIHIKYHVYKDDTYQETEIVQGTLSPEFNHSALFSFPSVTQDHLAFFENGKTEVWGT